MQLARKNRLLVLNVSLAVTLCCLQTKLEQILKRKLYQFHTKKNSIADLARRCSEKYMQHNRIVGILFDELNLGSKPAWLSCVQIFGTPEDWTTRS